FPSRLCLCFLRSSSTIIHQEGKPDPRRRRKSSCEIPNPLGDDHSVLRLSRAISPRLSKSARSCKSSPSLLVRLPRVTRRIIHPTGMQVTRRVMNAMMTSTVHEEAMLGAKMKVSLVGKDDSLVSCRRQFNSNHCR
ncbi:hypothetical protein COCMIDRAFT_110329, partial [Bipolaris oryzae ATCC 44560]